MGKVKKARADKAVVPTVVQQLLSVHKRTHRLDNVNRNNLTQYLDKMYVEGWRVIDGGLNISRDIGGTYEVVSFKDEN